LYNEAKTPEAYALQVLGAAGENGVEKNSLFHAVFNSGLMKNTGSKSVFEFGRVMLKLMRAKSATKVQYPGGKIIWYTCEAAGAIKHKLPPGTKVGQEVIEEESPVTTGIEYVVEIRRRPRRMGPYSRYWLYYTTDEDNWHQVLVSTPNLTIEEVEGPVPLAELGMGQMCIYASSVKIVTQGGEEIVRVDSFLLIG
jgi:hypothetical protein